MQAVSGPPPSQRLNPLATAKGQKLVCELTGKPASIVVNYFGVPYYYCDRTTLELDWNGIKQKIAQLLVPLRQPPSVIPSVEERERQEANVRKSKLALIDLCRMEATKFLVHGDFELSIPGAVQALRYSLDVYGAGKIELVPCYLLLAEANLGLGRHKQAEEYLSLANWSILKNPDCSNRTKSQLYRNFGKLYASQVGFHLRLQPWAPVWGSHSQSSQHVISHTSVGEYSLPAFLPSLTRSMLTCTS